MDVHLFLLINRSWTSPALDWVMAVASSWDFWWPFLAVGGLIVLWKGGIRARAMLLVLGLSIAVTDAVVVDTIKGIAERPRPNEVQEGARTVDLAKAKPRFLALGQPLQITIEQPGLPPVTGNSFPSGHASNNFAMATVVFLFYRRWGWLAFLPAALVSYSRVYVASHWPSDVVISSLLGAGLACLVAGIFALAWTRWSARFFPAVAREVPVLP
jgi:undecaprenyl-diphosphatase